MLHKALHEQGIVGKAATLSCTYVPTDLYAAWCAIQVLPVSQEELALEGVTQIAGAPNAEYLKHLPQTLEHMTFKDEFNQDLKPVKLSRNLQTLTFGSDFDRSLEQVTVPSSLQTLTFGTQFTRCLDRVTLPSSLQALTFGSGFNRLLWKARVPNWREPSTHPSEFVHAPMSIKFSA